MPNLNTFGVVGGIDLSALNTLPSTTRFTRDEIEFFYSHAYSVYGAGSYDKAQALFSWLRVYAPTDSRIARGLAWSLKMLGDYDSAATSWAFVALLEPENPEPVLRMAESLTLSGQTQEAARALRSLVDYCESSHRDPATCTKARDLLSALPLAA